MSTTALEQTTQQDSGEASGGGSILSQSSHDPAVGEATADVGVQEHQVVHEQVSQPVGKWRDSLPPELKEDPSLQKFLNVDDLAKSYIHAQKMIGADKIVLPSKHATEDDWKVLFQKLGQPQAMEEYKLTIPEGAQFDDGFISQFKEQAFKNNILPHQAQKMIEWYNEANNQALKEQDQYLQQQRESVLKELKQEFGQAFQVKLREAERGLTGLAGKAGLDVDAVWTWADSVGMNNDPNWIKLMSALGGLFKEDETIMTGAQRQGAITPSDAQKQLDAIYGNLEHPYFNKNHPGNKSAVEEVTRLMEAKLGQG